ncbi:hypothetical protein [Lyngbya sp. CCY1209]|jgi:hypothetical protein|uniref:hypothetical protein n=1 Tax=Lyngbya sp. CCY1209 TaxID=2886103 RepID=UPI002D20C0CE|nr:hypothetical protein [Lyngbya sp. CCY1209]MEB3883549.1 hypothetical protein [Lyngbya sp. CCY1209]
MPSVYLILLTFALGSIWVYLQTSEDIPFVLAGLTGIVCFIWGFAFAHWSLQILIVLGLLRLYKVSIPEGTSLR